MKINTTLIPHPRECLLHAILSDRYGHTPFVLEYAQVMIDLSVSPNTAKALIKRLESMQLISPIAGGKYVLVNPVQPDEEISSKYFFEDCKNEN